MNMTTGVTFTIATTAKPIVTANTCTASTAMLTPIVIVINETNAIEITIKRFVETNTSAAKTAIATDVITTTRGTSADKLYFKPDDKILNRGVLNFCYFRQDKLSRQILHYCCYSHYFDRHLAIRLKTRTRKQRSAKYTRLAIGEGV